jgi:hypothetical protein
VSARINVPDLGFAAFLVGVGVFAYVLASDLPMGSAAAMGPGYVPRALAAVIVLFGAAMGLGALFEARAAFPSVAIRPLLLVALAVALFALLLPRAGLLATGFVVVLCAGCAAPDMRWRDTLILALALAIFAVLLFVSALGLPLPIWPP